MEDPLLVGSPVQAVELHIDVVGVGCAFYVKNKILVFLHFKHVVAVRLLHGHPLLI